MQAGMPRVGPQILRKMFVSDATLSVKCIGSRLRVIESP